MLGTRWIYDAAHDPVAVAQLLAFVSGRVEAQHQSRERHPRPVGRPDVACRGQPAGRAGPAPGAARPGCTAVAELTDVARDDGDVSLDLVRVLR